MTLNAVVGSWSPILWSGRNGMIIRRMPIPPDYEERVYAGVLGKIIGVYLGRPFEGWSHRRIEADLGPIEGYVHERLGKPLVVADDDISGTFTFARALEDHGVSPDLLAEQIGRTWLNYLIEERTILWWGGMGTSTEHTAFLRLKHGISAPDSGSIETNGHVVAEQIGSQIFIDSWAMIAPGEPELAARLARAAASVSHDGEAIYGAQVVAAMESAAFFEADMDTLIDEGLRHIPDESLIARLIHDIREWHSLDGDWRTTFERIEATYGYDRYGGGCHMIPNHAVIILALLYGEGDFGRSLMVANTAGWDTDCNSGNVGCLLGLRGGLAAIDRGDVDWRGPVADRLYKISADGGDAVTDAVQETGRLVAMGRSLLRTDAEVPRSTRYHFELPGSVQGFALDAGGSQDPDTGSPDTVPRTLTNVSGHSAHGSRSLAIPFGADMDGPVRAGVYVFALLEDLEQPGYHMTLSSSLYEGHTIHAEVELDTGVGSQVGVALFVEVYPHKSGAEPRRCSGEVTMLVAGDRTQLQWTIPFTGGLPVLRVGLEIHCDAGGSGTVYLDTLTWDGAPSCRLLGSGLAERGAPVGWTDGVDRVLLGEGGEQLTLIHNEGRGLLINGSRQWADYRFTTSVSPHMAAEAGIAVRVGGMQRWVGLLLCPQGKVRLVACVDGDPIVQEADLNWQSGEWFDLQVTVRGKKLRAAVDGRELFVIDDISIRGGGVALVCSEGRAFFRDTVVQAVSAD